MEISPAHAVVLLLGGIFGGMIFIVAVGLILLFFLQRHHVTTSSSVTGDTSKTTVPSPLPSRRRRVYTNSNSRTMSSSNATRTKSLGSNCTSFTYEKLAKATHNFSQRNLLGEGAFGPVHKGVLFNGKLVAVKQLKRQTDQGEQEFQSEIEIISRIHHKHLVSLVGFCVDGDKRLLVYEYMQNNSLAFHLHGSEEPSLDWETRMQIAKGAANGLAYLHEDCEPRIIHRDIKSANILLDSNFRAKVSDFGLAKCIMDVDTHMATRVVGTLGYLAPEYGSNGRLTEKSDVYSFGVVLLELISGQKPHNLVHWLKPFFRALRDEIYDEVVDPKLSNPYNHDEMLSMVVCALACVDHAPEYRPKMLEVARVLEGTMSVEELKARVMSRGASTFRSHAQDQGCGNKQLPISNSAPFTYEELAKATDDFSQRNLLGEGGFGPVHRGVLVNGKLVAVKQLKRQTDHGEQEFQSEIEIISRVHHRHLVSLVGFCIDGDKRLLVYDYMENNSLAFHLHGSEVATMDWTTRMQIAKGAANGLAYLHEDCEPRIIHRDIKSANILLDSNFRAKVSDFGIAKNFLDADTHVTTRVIGTPGYVAPEYGFNGRLTEKSDVYSFGVVLLELISGRKPINFVHLAKPLLFQALRDDIYDEIVDPKLANAYKHDEMLRMVVCAGACIDHAPDYRPKMLEVVRVLGGTTSVEELKTRVMSREISSSNQIISVSRIPAAAEIHVQERGYSSTTNAPSNHPLVWVNNMRKRKNFWKFLEPAAGAFYVRDQGNGPDHLAISNCMRFKYKELAKATDEFSKRNLIGEGGSGRVYKGVLLDGKLVAVKQLESKFISQAAREFQLEIAIISRIRHRHLVSLLGFCIKGDKRLLVYEYMDNNTLGFHLHGSEVPTMDWATRMQIAKGAASGLAYLHEDCEPRVIHRDIKPTNILLDSNFRAKVSDFGLAKLIPDADTHLTTMVAGTIGYLAPDYMITGRITEKSDVYSFGVVLSELISGKKPVSMDEPNHFCRRKLLFQHALRDDVYDEIVDPTLNNAYNRDEMLRMVACAVACVDDEPKYRPKMLEVARVLEGTMSVEEFITRAMSRNTNNSTSQIEGSYDLTTFSDATGSIIYGR